MKTPEDEAFDDLAKRQGDWGGGYQAKKAMAADKLQEPAQTMKVEGPFHVVCQCRKCKAQPAQEPVACVMGTYGGMFVVGPLNPAMVLPVGMALYAGPQRPWVGLTLDEIEELFQSAAGADEETDIRFARLIEAKLKEKNNGT
jgi:hypothetical protein